MLSWWVRRGILWFLLDWSSIGLGNGSGRPFVPLQVRQEGYEARCERTIPESDSLVTFLLSDME